MPSIQKSPLHRFGNFDFACTRDILNSRRWAMGTGDTKSERENELAHFSWLPYSTDKDKRTQQWKLLNTLRPLPNLKFKWFAIVNRLQISQWKITNLTPWRMKIKKVFFMLKGYLYLSLSGYCLFYCLSWFTLSFSSPCPRSLQNSSLSSNMNSLFDRDKSQMYHIWKPFT